MFQVLFTDPTEIFPLAGFSAFVAWIRLEDPKIWQKGLLVERFVQIVPLEINLRGVRLTLDDRFLQADVFVPIISLVGTQLCLLQFLVQIQLFLQLHDLEPLHIGNLLVLLILGVDLGIELSELGGLVVPGQFQLPLFFPLSLFFPQSLLLLLSQLFLQ